MQPESSIPALIRFLITADHTCHSENQWASGPVRFLHAKVSIDHGSVLTSAYLTKIAKGNEVKWEHGPEQLSFSDHTPGDPLPRMLYHEFSYHLDVLVIDCKTNEIQVCNDRRDWRRRPRMHEIFAEKVDYILTIGLAGDGAESTTVELRFSWTGNWQTSFLHSQPSPTGKRVPSPEAKECLNRAAELLKQKKDGIIMNFHGLYRARAYDLQSNDDLIWVCDKLVAHGYSHPFEGLDECMPQSEWLDFMKWGHLHAKWDFGQEGGYLHAAIQWSNERGRPLDEKKVWRGVMAEVLDEHRYG